MVQGWWEGRQYYDYSTAYCGDDDDDDNRRKKRDDREEFDECQAYTQVYTVEPQDTQNKKKSYRFIFVLYRVSPKGGRGGGAAPMFIQHRIVV